MRNSSLFIILQKMRKPFLVIIVTYTISIIGFLFIGGKDSSGNYYQMTLFDAFYFVSYTATTIGFGEIPYAFTYPQRIWVTISTFLTVLGWFYSIGTLVSLLQDKLFLQELERARFLKQIKNLNEKFIIILGYNQITRKIIIKAIEQGIRAVVIEKDSLKISCRLHSFLCGIFKQLAALFPVFLPHGHCIYDRYKAVDMRPLLDFYRSEFSCFHVVLKRNI